MVFLLLSESVFLLLAPHIHNLSVLVHLHGVTHQSIHVDELDALLLSIKQHRRDDCQLSHLLLCVLMSTRATHAHKAEKKTTSWSEWAGLQRETETIEHIRTRTT